VFAAKVAGAWNLHTATRSLPLDFFLLFSSSTALFGNPGQANYAAANSFLDALAHARACQGLRAVAINWGAWSGMGMAARPEVLQHLARRGVQPLADVDGISAAERSLATNMAQLAVISLDWPKFLSTMEHAPFVQQFEAQRRTQTQRADSLPEFRIELESAEPQHRADLLLEHVRAQIAHVIGMDDPRSVSPKQGFFTLGLDSLTSVQLRARLQRSLQVTLPATVAFDYPTLEGLVSFLRREILPPALFTSAAPAALEKSAALADGAAVPEVADDAAIARELAELQTLLSRVG
jgi:myxalamid-type polyketide synthase MxaB